MPLLVTREVFLMPGALSKTIDIFCPCLNWKRLVRFEPKRIVIMMMVAKTTSTVIPIINSIRLLAILSAPVVI